MSSLYEIVGEIKALDALLQETGGDVSEGTQGQTLEKWAEEFDWKMRGKVDSYGALYRNLEADHDALAEEIKRLQDRKRSLESRCSRLEDLAKFSMERLGLRKLEGVKTTISIRKAGGQRRLELLVREEELPERFQKKLVTADNDAIRKAIEAKDPEIDGKAKLADQGEYVAIK